MTILGLTPLEILYYFLVYSILGWITEVVFQASVKGLVVNRGFLNGPVCPIYGFGVVGFLMIINLIETKSIGADAQKEPALMIFIVGMVLATLIELIGGWVLDKAFHARWWDYSNRPFNLHGYICLEFSVIWGLAILFVIRIVQPDIISRSECILHERWMTVVLAICYVLYIADFILSVLIMVGLNKKLAELDEIRESVRVVSDGLSRGIGEGTLKTTQNISKARVQATLAGYEISDEFREKKEQLYQKLMSSKHFGAGRLLRAFPDIRHRFYREDLEDMIARMRAARLKGKK